MNDLIVLVWLAVNLFAVVYIVADLERPARRVRIGRAALRRIVEVR